MIRLHKSKGGSYFGTSNKAIELNQGRRGTTLEVTHTGYLPIQVGSHFHFFETNKQLSFKREKAYGMRLDIPSGTSVRFEPGESKTVQLVEECGRKNVRSEQPHPRTSKQHNVDAINGKRM